MAPQPKNKANFKIVLYSSMKEEKKDRITNKMRNRNVAKTGEKKMK